MITIDRKALEQLWESSCNNGEGAIWWNMRSSNQDLVLRCFGRLDVEGLHGHRSLHQPEGEHYTRHRVTRWKLTQKTDAERKRQDTQREKINCVFLAFIKVCQGKKMCLCFLKAPRDLFVNVTLVKSSATMSPVVATFSLEQRKTSGCKWQNNPLVFILFYFWMIFGHLQANKCENWNPHCNFYCIVN